MTDAICEQAQRMVTCPGIFYNDRRAQLLAKLAEITGVLAELGVGVQDVSQKVEALRS